MGDDVETDCNNMPYWEDTREWDDTLDWDGAIWHDVQDWESNTIEWGNITYAGQ
ncbi:hypothetical protein [Phocaeicola sp.]